MSIDNTNLEAVKTRIKKLLAIAQDGRANPNEAASAAAMAEKVMRKFQIDHADLIEAELKTGAGMATADVFAFMRRSKVYTVPTKNPMWAQWLAVDVAKFNDCHAGNWILPTTPEHHGGACLRFFGYKSDVEMCAWMFDYLVGVIVRECKAWQKADFRSKKESESYRRGFTLTVCAKLVAERQAKQAEQATTGRGLMVVKQQAIEQHFGKFTYNEPTPVSIGEQSAFAAGVRDGAKVDATRRALGSDSEAKTAIE